MPPTPHRADRRARIRALSALGLAVLAAGLAVQDALGPDAVGRDGAPPACATVPREPPAGETVTCTTDTATLTIGGERAPLLLGADEVRVLDAARDGDEVRARLRVRNSTGTAHSFSAREQAYLSVGGERVVPFGAVVRIAPGAARTVELRWRLSDAVESAARKADDRVDLGVVPHGQARRAEPDRLGVVRLEL